MMSALFLASALATASVSQGPPGQLEKTTLDAYATAKAKAARTPDAQVKLALWCEAHGLSAERTKHLMLATLLDPANAAARGLMGLVSYQGKWQPPAEVARQAQEDPARKALLQGISPAPGQDIGQAGRPVEAGPLVRGAGTEGPGDGASVPGSQARSAPGRGVEAAGIQEGGRAVGQAGVARHREGRTRGAEPLQQVLEAPARALAQATELSRQDQASRGGRGARPDHGSPRGSHDLERLRAGR